MKGLILINAYAPIVRTRQVERLESEFGRLGISVDVMRNDGFVARVQNGAAVLDTAYDFCLYLDKDKYTSHIMQKFMRLFNSAEAIELCDDKMTTHISLSGGGIPMPDTIPAPLCYDRTAKITANSLEKIIAVLGLPTIVKTAYGSMGSGVYKADTFDELERLANELKLTPHLYQKYIASSSGKDMRVIVVGDRVLGGIMRESSTDFRSNVALGGKATRVEVPSDIRSYALKASRMLGLDYCGIDFLLGDTPLLCEVNSNAFFDAFEDATGINVAKAYATHITEILAGAK